jgi:hypothetical protein
MIRNLSVSQPRFDLATSQIKVRVVIGRGAMKTHVIIGWKVRESHVRSTCHLLMWPLFPVFMFSQEIKTCLLATRLKKKVKLLIRNISRLEMITF